MNGARQQGAVILIFITIVLLGVTTLLVTQLSVNKQKNQRQTSTLTDLATAKQNLVGYALRQPIPGTLPCPDTNGDGLANPQGANCQALLGLLPYRTLNLPVLTDGTGARLWYAVAANYTSNAATLKNSSITSNLTLDGQTMAAVVLAPEAQLNNQNRRPLNRTDHLEGVNADADFTTFTAIQSDTQNDQVVGISPAVFWSVIERHVLTNARALLNQYRAQCGEYPWAADFGGPFNSVNNQQRGALPLVTALPNDWGTVCAGGIAPIPPVWLRNHWSSQVLYRMCQTVQGNCVNIIGSAASPAPGVLVAPGITLAGQVRPDNDVNDYFEDENASLPDNQYREAGTIDHDATYNDTTRALSP